MKFCEECGAQLEDDVQFCEECGARVETKEQTVTAEQTAAKDQADAEEKGGEKGKEKAFGNRGWIVAVVILLLALTGIGVVFFAGKEESQQPETEISSESAEESVLEVAENSSETNPESEVSETETAAATESAVSTEEEKNEETQLAVSSASMEDIPLGYYYMADNDSFYEWGGGQAIEIQSVSGDEITFTMSCVDNLPTQRIATAEVRCKLTECAFPEYDFQAFFSYEDSWEVKGEGNILFNVEKQTCKLFIDIPGIPNADWHLSMDSGEYLHREEDYLYQEIDQSMVKDGFQHLVGTYISEYDSYGVYSYYLEILKAEYNVLDFRLTVYDSEMQTKQDVCEGTFYLKNYNGCGCVTTGWKGEAVIGFWNGWYGISLFYNCDNMGDWEVTMSQIS